MKGELVPESCPPPSEKLPLEERIRIRLEKIRKYRDSLIETLRAAQATVGEVRAQEGEVSEEIAFLEGLLE